MSTYTIINTRGNTIGQIPTSTTNTTFSPLSLPGFAYNGFGNILDNDLYAMMENFASPSAPTNSLEGLIWYNSTTKTLAYYDSANYVPISGGYNNASQKLAVINTPVDFTSATTTTILNNISGHITIPTGILIYPNTTPTATTPPAFNLYVSNAEDVLDVTVVDNMATGFHAYYPIYGTANHLNLSSDTLKLQINSAATGGSLLMNVLVFGLTI